MKATRLLVLILLSLLLCTPILSLVNAEETIPNPTPTPTPSSTPSPTPIPPRPSPTPTVDGLKPLILYKTEILSPNSTVYYTDLMPLNFTVEWRKNVTWVSWIVPHFSYSIDNGSMVEIEYEQFIQGGPYIDWENKKIAETTVTTETIDVSNLTDGSHTLTLYSYTLVAAGQLVNVDCILATVEFHAGELPTPWTKTIEANTIPIIAGLTIVLAVASVGILYLKRKQSAKKS